MPFTFSHPAIVLPLIKYFGRYFSWTGLIIGSMTPDFEYFLRTKIQSYFSHTIGGLFYFDLPIGVLLSFVFHNFIRNTLYDNLPNTYRSRLTVYKTFDWNNYFKEHYFVVISSVFIGSSSHLFWDSFTHLHGYFTQTYPILQSTFDIAGYKIRAYKLLQHFSSLIGGLVIGIAFFKLPKNLADLSRINLTYWLAVLIISMALVSVRLAFGIDKSFFGQVIAITVDAILLALVIAPALVSKKNRLS